MKFFLTISINTSIIIEKSYVFFICLFFFKFFSTFCFYLQMFNKPLDNLLRMIAGKLILFDSEKPNELGLKYHLKGLYNTACFSHALSAVVFGLFIPLVIILLLWKKLKRVKIRTLIAASFSFIQILSCFLAIISIINLLSFGIKNLGICKVLMDLGRCQVFLKKKR